MNQLVKPILYCTLPVATILSMDNYSVIRKESPINAQIINDCEELLTLPEVTEMRNAINEIISNTYSHKAQHLKTLYKLFLERRAKLLKIPQQCYLEATNLYQHDLRLLMEFLEEKEEQDYDGNGNVALFHTKMRRKYQNLAHVQEQHYEAESPHSGNGLVNTSYFYASNQLPFTREQLLVSPNTRVQSSANSPTPTSIFDQNCTTQEQILRCLQQFIDRNKQNLASALVFLLNEIQSSTMSQEKRSRIYASLISVISPSTAKDFNSLLNHLKNSEIEDELLAQFFFDLERCLTNDTDSNAINMFFEAEELATAIDTRRDVHKAKELFSQLLINKSLPKELSIWNHIWVAMIGSIYDNDRNALHHLNNIPEDLSNIPSGEIIKRIVWSLKNSKKWISEIFKTRNEELEGFTNPRILPFIIAWQQQNLKSTLAQGVSKDRVPVVKILLKKSIQLLNKINESAAIEAIQDAWNYCFQRACNEGNCEMVKLSLQILPPSLIEERRYGLKKAVDKGHFELVRYLIESELDSIIPEKLGLKLLKKAVSNNFLSIVCYLHQKGAPLENNLLRLATRHAYNKEKLIGYLLRAGLQDSLPIDDVKSVFRYTVKKGQFENSMHLLEQSTGNREALLKQLLKYGEVGNAIKSGDSRFVALLIEAGKKSSDNVGCGVFGESHLHTAAEAGQVNVANMLITRFNESINKKESRGRTPLHYAAEKGHDKMINFLLSKGADLRVEDRFGYTALHLAAQVQHLDCCKLLIHHGAAINGRTHEGATPLMLAVQNSYYNHPKEKRRLSENENNVELVKFLLANGASVLGNYYKAQYTVLHYAVLVEGTDIALKIVKALIQNGANLNSEDITGETPLHLAFRNFNIDNYTDTRIAAFLISQGADIEKKDKEGRTPLLRATKKDYSYFDLELLLANGANLMVTEDWSRRTPLHFAVQSKDICAVELLLKKGCNVNAKDKYGKTPLDLAKKNNGNNEIIPLLITKGAH